MAKFVLGAGALLCALPATAGANTIAVDSLGDGGGECTLRAAITAAATNAASGACGAGSVALDTIEITGNGGIGLNSALPSLEGELAIEGPNAQILTVYRASASPFRIFHVGSTASVTISGITISSGRIEAPFAIGGGIYAEGDLTLREARVADNSAFASPGSFAAGAIGGAIYSGPGTALNIIDSYFDGNMASATSTGGDVTTGTSQAAGGAIYSEGGLRVEATTLTGNSSSATSSSALAQADGAILSRGVTQIYNSTLNGNLASALGGTSSGVTRGAAISHLGEAGFGLDVSQSTITGNQSTTSGPANLEQGVVYIGSAPGAISSSTIAQNGGEDGSGLWVNAAGETVTYISTILGDPEGPMCVAPAGTLTSQGFNLVEDASCTGVNDPFGDPKLGALTDNGSRTATMLPAADSLAIDAGVDASPLVGDQRGEGRPRDLVSVANVVNGDGSDIGAVERQTTTLTPKGIDFGQVTPEAAASPELVTMSLANYVGAFFVSAPTITGPSPDDFTISEDSCSLFTLQTITPVCEFTVNFEPNTSLSGERSATVNVTESGSPSAIHVSLNGEVPDTVAPNTAIAGLKLNAKKRQATLRFSGSDDKDNSLSFSCSLDGKPFKACTSPKVYKRLKLGRHTFKVQARDAYGNVDPSPAVKSFKLKK